MKHLKTAQELNESEENLNISDVSDSLLQQLEIYQSNINKFCEEAKKIKDENKLWIITNELSRLSKFLSREI
jgi:archaellum biogenesis ATPase FlaH